jgi:hypothetical protein
MAHEKGPKGQINPGAGAYNPHGVSAVEERFKSSKSKVQGFGARAERKGWARNMEIPFNTPFYQTTPGPGTYGEKRTAFNKQNRKMLIEETIGFGATGQRPCMNAKKETKVGDGPGPGAYLSGSSYGTITSGIQAKAGVGRNGIFGSTSHRFSHGVFEEIPEGIEEPGPGSFEQNPPDSFEQMAGAMGGLPAPNSDVAARRQQQGVFKSKSSRFGSNRPLPDHASLGIEAQEPGVYEINLPSEFDAKKTSGVMKKPQPFASTASRFNGKQFMGQVKETTPGPGAYGKPTEEASTFVIKPAARRPLAPPGTISMDARFKSGAGSFANTQNTPGGLGPGSYDTGGTMQRKSYNITMVHK